VVDIAWHEPAGVFGGLIAKPQATPARSVPPKRDYSDEVILLGRLREGATTESRRVVHVFPLTPELLRSTVVTARCGEPLTTSDLQWLPGLTGMPCEQCVMAE
jgi:hypothetical protein